MPPVASTPLSPQPGTSCKKTPANNSPPRSCASDTTDPPVADATGTQRRSRRNQSGTEVDHHSLPLFVACTAIAFAVAFLPASRLPAAAIGGPAGQCLLSPGWSVLVAGLVMMVAGIGLRHPSYTGSLTTIVGTGLALGNWATLAVLTIVPTLALLFRIRVEETALLTGLGEPYRRHSATSAPGWLRPSCCISLYLPLYLDPLIGNGNRLLRGPARGFGAAQTPLTAVVLGKWWR